VLNVFVFIEG